jgi:hypothetical protein
MRFALPLKPVHDDENQQRSQPTAVVGPKSSRSEWSLRGRVECDARLKSRIHSISVAMITMIGIEPSDCAEPARHMCRTNAGIALQRRVQITGGEIA